MTLSKKINELNSHIRMRVLYNDVAEFFFELAYEEIEKRNQITKKIKKLKKEIKHDRRKSVC